MKSLFSGNTDAAVIGASGGIGHALLHRLGTDPGISRLWALSRTRPAELPKKAVWVPLDVTDEESVRSAAEAIGESGRPLGLAIVASGVLQGPGGSMPEKAWRSIDADAMLQIFAVNTVGPALIAKHFLPLLATDARAVFAALSARVGSITDNQAGGWYSYRASKAALNMLIKSLSIELARRNSQALCVGLHPGTVATALSAPFVDGRVGHVVVPPEQAARNLLGVLTTLSPSDSGACFAWDGSQIAP